MSNMQKNFHQQTGQNFVATTSAFKIYKMRILKDSTPNCLFCCLFLFETRSLVVPAGFKLTA